MNINCRCWYLFPTVCGLAISAAALAQTGVASYDSFSDGPRADLDGSTAGSGWTSAWMDMGQGGIISVTDHSDGLSYMGLGVKPGCAEVPEAWYPGMVSYTRGHAAITGNTMYLSFLLRPRADASNWFTLRLGTWPNQVDVGVPMGSYQYGFMLGDGVFALSPVPVQVGKTVFLVLEVEHVTTTNTTAYRMYVNPTPGQPKPSWAMAEYGRAGLRAFGSYVEPLGYGGYTIDEVRFGSTWSQVTPCTADFNADGFVNALDYDEFAGFFELADPGADINADGFVNALDYDVFASAFEAGC
ncbi:MAG: hypothetical protein IT432_11390 [Phycisphaerales bacterium]|nr:hypothetical protein [Phycisphaerales bacterium]